MLLSHVLHNSQGFPVLADHKKKILIWVLFFETALKVAWEVMNCGPHHWQVSGMRLGLMGELVFFAQCCIVAGTCVAMCCLLELGKELRHDCCGEGSQEDAFTTLQDNCQQEATANNDIATLSTAVMRYVADLTLWQAVMESSMYSAHYRHLAFFLFCV